MAILREWRALIRRDRNKEYLDYVYATGITAYRRTAGCLWAAAALRDIDEERSEIVTLSLWTVPDAIKAFAGDDIERARYFPKDDDYLLTKPDKVAHYECGSCRSQSEAEPAK